MEEDSLLLTMKSVLSSTVEIMTRTTKDRLFYGHTVFKRILFMLKSCSCISDFMMRMTTFLFLLLHSLHLSNVDSTRHTTCTG